MPLSISFFIALFRCYFILGIFRKKKTFLFLNYQCTRDQLNKNTTLLNRSLNDDRIHKAEHERSELQRSLVQTSSQYDQLSSEKYGLTVALDELRRKNKLYLTDLICIFLSS